MNPTLQYKYIIIFVIKATISIKFHNSTYHQSSEHKKKIQKRQTLDLKRELGILCPRNLAALKWNEPGGMGQRTQEGNTGSGGDEIRRLLERLSATAPAEIPLYLPLYPRSPIPTCTRSLPLPPVPTPSTRYPGSTCPKSPVPDPLAGVLFGTTGKFSPEAEKRLSWTWLRLRLALNSEWTARISHCASESLLMR